MQELYISSHLVMNELKKSQQTQSSAESQLDRNCIKIKNKSLDSGSWNHHAKSVGRDSSEDPGIASTQAVDRHLSSNTRVHPRAELNQTTPTPNAHGKDLKKAWHGSNHAHNHVSSGVKSGDGRSHDTPSTNGKRPRSKEGDVGAGEDDVWTEHVSSSGRTYYYNKRLDKSQWERPKGAYKKAKTDSTPSKKPTSSSGPVSTPATSHSHHRDSAHHSSSSHTHKGSSHRDSGSHTHRESSGHTHKDGGHSHRESGSHAHSSSSRHREGGEKRRDRGSSGGRGVKESDRDRHHRDRGKPRDSSRHHKSRSHSGSSSPPSKHGGGGVAKSTPSSATGTKSLSSSSSGRNHGNTGSSHAQTVVEKSTQRTPNHPALSPAGSTPRGSGIQLISPTTPGSGCGGSTVPLGSANSLPATLSHTLTATRQLIDHTSILIQQHHQKVLQGRTSETTPTPLMMTTPTMTNRDGTPVGSGTPYSHQAQPLARKRLSLTPQAGFQHDMGIAPPPSGYTHHQQSQPSSSSPQVHGMLYQSPQAGVATPTSQAPVDNTGLHPLQRALLIQQKIQQHPPHQTPPTAPPTAIPHHMTSGAPPSHSGSPIAQSPAPLTPSTPGGGGGAPPVYTISMVPNPMTPLQQGVFAMPTGGGTPANFDPSLLAAQSQQPVLTSQVLQKVVSKLAYLGTNPDLMQFPEGSGLDKPAAVPGGSQVSQELVERELGVLWLRHQEHLSKQMEQGRLETLKRRTVDSFFGSSQLNKKRLALAAGEVKTASRNQRLRHLQALFQELEKR